MIKAKGYYVPLISSMAAFDVVKEEFVGKTMKLEGDDEGECRPRKNRTRLVGT